MTIFELLSFRNFMQYGNNMTVVNLHRPGTTLIQGEDLDNTTNGKTANGVGKTTIIHALCFCIYGKVLGDHTVDQMVNDINLKDMEVGTDFTGVDGAKYRVIRYRKHKALGGNGVKFYRDGVEKTRVGKEMQADIEAAVGMAFDIFVRTVVFTASHRPFLSLPTSSTTGVSQKGIIEELFSMTDLTTKAEALKAKMKLIEADLKLKNATTSQAQAELDRHAAQIVVAKRRVADWYTANDTQIATLMMKLKKAQGVDIAGQQALHDQYNALEKPMTQLARVQQATTVSLRDRKRILAEKTQEYKHIAEGTCPYCKQEYDSADKKAALIADIERLTTECNEAQTELTEINKDYELLEREQAEISAQIVVANIGELAKTAADADNINARIEELSVESNPHESALVELQKLELPPVDYVEVNRLEKQLEHQKLLLKLLTKPDSFVRKSLLAGNLHYLNQQLKLSLVELGLPHQVEFMSDMTPKISINGRERAFHQLSAGQTARVNFALALTFADVRSRRHGKVNLCLFDEVLDSGLDAVGVQLAAKLIKHRARQNQTTTFVVSHREEAAIMFDSRLTVQLSQGFSNIVDESIA